MKEAAQKAASFPACSDAGSPGAIHELPLQNREILARYILDAFPQPGQGKK
jgi:hypothetical protein